MTTHKGTQLKNGDILELRTNPGAAPKYFLNDKEIDMIDYWYYLQDDQYEKTREILEAAFCDWEIEELVEYEQEISEGIGHHGQSALVGMIARKPKN